MPIGGMAVAFKKQEVAGKARKTKRVSEADWVLLQDVKDMYGLQRGQQLNISQAKGMGLILEPCAPTLKPA